MTNVDAAASLEALRFLLADLRATPSCITDTWTDADRELVNARVNAILDEIELIATPRKLPERVGRDPRP